MNQNDKLLLKQYIKQILQEYFVLKEQNAISLGNIVGTMVKDNGMNPIAFDPENPKYKKKANKKRN